MVLLSCILINSLASSPLTAINQLSMDNLQKFLIRAPLTELCRGACFKKSVPMTCVETVLELRHSQQRHLSAKRSSAFSLP